MRHYIDVVENRSGTPIASASVDVYLAGTTTAATIYSDDGVTTKANPLTTDAGGVFDFYVADGRYDLRVTGTVITTLTQVDVEISDLHGGAALVLIPSPGERAHELKQGRLVAVVGLEAAGD